MPENPSPNQGWKNKATGPAKKENAAWKQQPDAKATGPAGGGTRDWQNRTATSAELPGPKSWGTRLAVAVGLVSVFIVGVAWVIYLLRPLQPACLVLLGASYDVNLALPHNVYGWQGLKELADHADKTGFVDSLFSAPSKIRLAYPAAGPGEVRGKDSWDKLWDRMPDAFAQKTVVVYLAMHGGGDDKGAYLFLGDRQAKDKVYVKTIIEALSKKAHGKNILLVLEPAQMGAYWPSGMLQNQFVRKLNELKTDIEKQPGLLVLCASDVDQISWPSEEWRGTIFAHYLIEGLRGAADQREFGGDADSRVTAAELFNYVRARVSAWAQSTRGTPQTPVLLGGEQRARDTGLVQIEKAYTEQSSHEATGGKPTSNELDEAWRSCTALSARVPAPAVYTPHLWRWYRDALLRWEQLERAGASAERIAILKEKCAVLERDIKRQSKAREDLTSWVITRALPLPGVLGAASTEAHANDELITAAWSLLWRAENKDAQRKVLQDLRTKANVKDKASEQGMALYGQLCRQLLATISPDDFKAPADLMARVLLLETDFSFNKKRPAEINYLMALLNDLDTQAMPPGKDLKMALDVRVLAEEAALAAPASLKGGHSHSEMVNPWISSKIKEADAQRRRGEDYLFGGDKEWVLARKELLAAKRNYQEALDDAAVIRKALDLRDRALADLPYYAEWLVRRPFQPGAEHAEQRNKLVKQVENLSEHLGNLTWALKTFEGQDFREKPPDRNPNGLSRKELMAQWIGEVKNDFTNPKYDLVNQFKAVCVELQKAPDQPVLWQDLEAALATPLIDPELRKPMLSKSRSMSGKFLQEFNDKKPITSKEEKPEEAADKERRQERLARAVLVPNWQDDHPLNSAVANDKELAADLARNIGAYWQELPDHVTEKYMASCQSVNLNEATEQLRDLDFRCRLLPGGSVAWLVEEWKSELPYGPPQGLRNLRVHDLLLTQSERVRNDYWFTEAREPYYAPAAKDYAHMAQDLAVVDNIEIIKMESTNSARKKKAKQLADLAVVTRLIPRPPANSNWTSEPEFGLTWKIDVDKNIPPGTPTCWLRIDEGALKKAQSQGPEFFQRQAASKWPPEKTYYLASPSEKERHSSDRKGREATFFCLYRGQEIESPKELVFCEPDTIVRHFPPAKAGLAFRLAEDFDYGAISIVLDCSGSMNNVVRGKKRFKHATDALDKALQRIYPNTFVSLLVFINTEEYGGKTRFKMLQEPKRWKEDMRADLIEKVEGLKFKQGASPILAALVESRDLGFPKDTEVGSKLIVALTDGDDNWSFGDSKPSFYNGPVDNPDEMDAEGKKAYNIKVGRRLRQEFAEKNIQIHMVCFNQGDTKANKDEIGRAQDQFKKTIEEFMDPPGTFQLQPDPDKLADDLINAVRPKLHLQANSKDVRGFPKEVTNYSGGERDWTTDLAGEFTAWVQNRNKAQNIFLHPGDLMTVNLKRNRKSRDIILERSVFANEVKDSKKITKGDLLISALQNQIDRKEEILQQLITVEKTSTPARIEQQPLGFFWLEVKPKGAMPSGQVTWRRDYGYPAPAFRLKIQNWRKIGGDWPLAETALWWAVKYPESSVLLGPTDVDGFKAEFASGKPLTVGNAQIRIDGVNVEDEHEIETASGDKVKKTCLVVRVSHEAKKPVFVLLKPESDDRYSEEHRFYPEAQKCTALFCGLRDPKSIRFTLRVISLDDFKKESEMANRWARFDSLVPTVQPGPPRVGETGSP